MTWARVADKELFILISRPAFSTAISGSAFKLLEYWKIFDFDQNWKDVLGKGGLQVVVHFKQQTCNFNSNQWVCMFVSRGTCLSICLSKRKTNKEIPVFICPWTWPNFIPPLSTFFPWQMKTKLASILTKIKKIKLKLLRHMHWVYFWQKWTNCSIKDKLSRNSDLKIMSAFWLKILSFANFQAKSPKIAKKSTQAFWLKIDILSKNPQVCKL